MIISPCDGIVERVQTFEEMEEKSCGTCFFIRRKDGILEEVKKLYKGRIKSLEVREGEEVVRGMVLAYVEEFVLEP